MQQSPQQPHPPNTHHKHTHRLLARACCAAALRLPWPAVEIARTRGRKPYCANAEGDRSAAPNFNFNVSHEVGVTVSVFVCCVLYVCQPKPLTIETFAP